MRYQEKILTQKDIYQGKVVHLQVAEVELPNNQIGHREMIKHQGAVAIAALTKDKEVLLVEQFRVTCDEFLLEVPAGKLEKGEVPEAAALRELQEETGYTTDQLVKMYEGYTTPGFTNELLRFYCAIDVELMTERIAMDDDEFIELVKIPLADIPQMLKEQKFKDLKTITALQFLIANYS